jgi:multidrug transporter EmrE-like cation transporter
VADALLKRLTAAAGFGGILRSPWMIAVVGLYLGQIVFFAYVFTQQWDLGLVGTTQVAFYAVTVVLTGLLLFGETLSLMRVVGIMVTITGVFLMNLASWFASALFLKVFQVPKRIINHSTLFRHLKVTLITYSS